VGSVVGVGNKVMILFGSKKVVEFLDCPGDLQFHTLQAKFTSFFLLLPHFQVKVKQPRHRPGVALRVPGS